MKLSKLALLMLLNPAVVLAYYGQPSFKLEDDPDFRVYQQNQAQAKFQLAEAEKARIEKEKSVKNLEQELIALRTKLQNLPQEKNQLNTEKNTLTTNIQNLKAEISLLETGFNQIKTQANEAQAQLKIANAKTEAAKAELQNLNTQCTQAPSADCQAKVEAKKVEIGQLEAELKKAQDTSLVARKNLEEAQKPLERKRAELVALESRSQQIDTKLAEILKLEQNSQQRENQILSELNRQKTELLQLIKRLDEAERRMAETSRTFNQYREDLIRSIDQVNREGYINGERDGDIDGTELSRNMGRDIGLSDGRSDGLRDGERAGRERDYNRGSQVGEIEGSERGRFEGDRDGRIQGTDAGHIDAGNREGKVAGIQRAEKSDAVLVGTKQGETDGLNRAIKKGMEVGSLRGEGEAVALYENSDLKQAEIKGEFLGAFERRTPSMPSNYQGPRFNPNRPASKEVFRRAYYDGYAFKYRDEVYAEFIRRIDADYNQSYDTHYQGNYRSAVEREYRDTYEDGRRSQDQRAYAREYSPARNRAFDISFKEISANPNRQDTTYKTAYRSMEAHAYSEKYEEIRSTTYTKVEAQTFDKNIAQKTEEFRQKRLAEVKAIYENHPVAEYVSSSIQDGGISNVARLDGVYMPGERILRTIVIKNYGKKDLVGAKAQFVSGEDIALPNIPARSITTIVNGAMSTISLSEKNGALYKDHMRVQLAPSSKDPVQLRHYEDLGKNLLKALDTKDIRVQYPLQLSALSLSDAFALINKKQNLKVQVSNISKRAYSEAITIDLKTNGNIIAKPFNTLNGLQVGSVNLSDAELLVASEKETYVPLRISADIKIQGVKVGELALPLDLMARAPYVEKAGKAVIVTNSNVNAQDLLQVLDLVGGIEAVSVLDLALGNLNQTVVTNGLQDKAAILVDDGQGSVTKLTEALVINSKNSLFVHADQNAQSLKVARAFGAFKDNQSFPFTLAQTKAERRMYFTNPHRTQIKGMTMHVQSSLEAAVSDLEIFKPFADANATIVQNLKNQVNRSNFFAPQRNIQIAAIKSLGEVMNISVAYDESGGIFNRDKKWIKLLENDGNMIHNLMKANANGSLSEATAGIHLAAIAYKDIVGNSLSYYKPVSGDMKLKVRSTTKDILENMEDNFKKNLKKFDRGLYDNAYEKFSLHRPYTIDIPSNDTNL